ncbi:MAG: hypothetical protein NVSMB14_04060 [Isosphaeraceae bacterium]
MTVETVKECNKKTLAQMAKVRGIVGWHAMRKDQLIRALTPGNNGNGHRALTPGGNGNGNGAHRHNGSTARNGSKPVVRSVATSGRDPSRRGLSAQSTRLPAPLPSSRPLNHACAKDRIITMVRDPYWLHTYWELSRSTLTRAQAALGQEWHAARPILRLMDVSSDEITPCGERHVRDIEIHGGVNNLYIDVPNPPRSFRVDVGYLTRRGKFYILARSNVVTTPKAGQTDLLDQNWMSFQEQFQRLHRATSVDPCQVALTSDLRELIEERMQRPMSSLSLQGMSLGPIPGLDSGFHFELDAELIVHGSTVPSARVTLQGEPVPVAADGTFSVRFSLPDSRQIIPAVASSQDGIEERTIVLAVERNTKELEPMIHDCNEA